MKKQRLFFFAFFALLLLILVFPINADAQCAMCKASAEANLKAGGGDPKGLNTGILYMLALPYLIVGGIGYMWWRNRRKEPEPIADFSEEDFSRDI